MQVGPSGPGRFFFVFERKGLLPQHRPEKMMKIERNNGMSSVFSQGSYCSSTNFPGVGVGPNRADKKNEGQLGEKITQKWRNSCNLSSEGVEAEGMLTNLPNCSPV